MKRITRISLVSALLVLLAHTFIENYQGSLTPISIFLMFVILFLYLRKYKDIWEFILILFICNHFSLGENNGGAFSYLILTAPIILKFAGVKIEKKNRNNFVWMFFGVLFTSVIIGNISSGFNPFIQSLSGIIKILSNIIIFILASQLIIDRQKIHDLITSMGVLMVYNVIVTLNQRFQFLYLPFYTAFMPPSNRNLSQTGALLQHAADDTAFLLTENVRPMGTFVHFELLGEYSLFCVILFLCFYLIKSSNFNKKHLMIFIFSGIFVIINTLNRGPVILLPIFYLFIVIGLSIKFRNYFRLNILMFILPIAAIIIIQFYSGVLANTGIFARFEQESTIGLIPVNREYLWLTAVAKFSTVPIWGMGATGGGVFFEQYVINVAPHSLYLALPFYYGWIAGPLFIFFIFLTIYKLYSKINYFKVIDYKVFAFGLILVWSAFLIDEYKIDMLRLSLYQNIIYFLLGISWSLIYTKESTVLLNNDIK